MARPRYRFSSQPIQSLVVGAATFAAAGVAWLLLWPYSFRALGGLIFAAIFGIGAATGSWLRSHDAEWEEEHLRTEPLIARLRKGKRRGAESPAPGGAPDSDAVGKRGLSDRRGDEIQNGKGKAGRSGRGRSGRGRGRGSAKGFGRGRSPQPEDGWPLPS